jgi:toxin FitB
MRAVADTSVIVAAALQTGVGHAESLDALRTSDAAAAGHAWVESFSVLTRLPRDVRLSGSAAARVLGAVVPRTRSLSADEQRDFARWVPESGIVGGAVYDALVGWTARCAGLPLLTRDTRAVPTYRSLGVDVLLIAPTLA